jgi:hypothetical protein
MFFPRCWISYDNNFIRFMDCKMYHVGKFFEAQATNVIITYLKERVSFKLIYCFFSSI